MSLEEETKAPEKAATPPAAAPKKVAAAAPKPVWARLRAYDKRAGALAKTYSVNGVRFEAGGGAKEVPPEIGDRLRGIKNASPKAPLMFEVSAKPFPAARKRRK